MLLTINEACKKFNISKNTIHNWKKLGLKYIKNKKGIVLLNVDDISNFIKSYKPQKEPPNGIKCVICEEITKYKNYRQFTLYHLKDHNITPKEYYDKLYPNMNKCQCGKEKTFLSITRGYTQFCNDINCKFKKEYATKQAKNTCLEKYGNEKYRNWEKKKKTSLEKYGKEDYTNRKKYKKTIKEKYGVDNLMFLDEFKDKVNETKLKKYGTSKYVNKCKISKTNIDKFIPILKQRLLKFDIELINYKSVKNIKIQCNKCNKISIQNSKLLYYRTFYNITPCLNCIPKVKPYSSKEKEIYNFIKNNCDLNVIENDKSTIQKEIDIFIPNLNLAIEFNGVYWHSDIIKHKKYHLNKTEECKEKGIQLIHIFEDEWVHNKNMIKCKLLNILNKTQNKIYARKCKIVECTTNQQREFYDNNHQQGYVQSKISYGLEYQNEIVAMMSFSSNRNLKKYDFELVRYATKKDSNVVGGASKLLTAFSRNYPNKKIVSYADRCWSDGKLYETIGFKLSKISPPTYFYVDPYTMIREHRFNFRKERLKKLGYDIEGRTEKEIMDEDTQYLRIYNCGYLVYEFFT